MIHTIVAGLVLAAALFLLLGRERCGNDSLHAIYKGKRFKRRYDLQVADIYSLESTPKGKYLIECATPEAVEHIKMPIDKETAAYVSSVYSQPLVDAGEPFCGINVYSIVQGDRAYISPLPRETAFLPQPADYENPEALSGDQAGELNIKIGKMLSLAKLVFAVSFITAWFNIIYAILLGVIAAFVALRNKKFSVLQKTEKWYIIKVRASKKTTNTGELSPDDLLPPGFSDWSKQEKYIFSLYRKYGLAYTEDGFHLPARISHEETEVNDSAVAEKSADDEQRVVQAEHEEESEKTAPESSDSSPHLEAPPAQPLPTPVSVSETASDSSQREGGAVSVPQEAAADVESASTANEAHEEQNAASIPIASEELSGLSELQQDPGRDAFDAELGGGQTEFVPTEFNPDSSMSMEFDMSALDDPKDLSLAGEGMVEISDETPPEKTEDAESDSIPIPATELSSTPEAEQAAEAVGEDMENLQGGQPDSDDGDRPDTAQGVMRDARDPAFESEENSSFPLMQANTSMAAEPQHASETPEQSPDERYHDMKNQFPHSSSRQKHKQGPYTKEKQWKRWEEKV
jgi:hypothetical protein